MKDDSWNRGGQMAQRRNAISARHGWLLAIVPALMLGVLLWREVWDVDIFWQLKLGEMILADRAPVSQEPFAVTHLGEPLNAVAWLGQAAFAAVRQAWGWTGLRVFDALCWCGGFWAVAAACRRSGARAMPLSLALLLAFGAALPAASIRPQSFGALCFGLLLALLKLELRAWQTVMLGTILLVAWQNLHPSVSIGIVALAAHAMAGWAVWLRDKTQPRPLAATMLVPIAALSVFATPDGVGILAVSARNAQASIAVGASEWLPLWIEANRENAVPILLVTLVAAFAAWRDRRAVSWPDLAVMLALLVLMISAYRFVLFWAVATIPVIAGRGRTPEKFGRASWLPVLGVVAVAVLAPAIRPTRFSDNLPMTAVARLAQTDAAGTIITEPEFAGVLIDAGYPRWRVSLDGRYYRYTDEEWQRYGAMLDGSYRLRAIERLYRPAAFVLRPSHSVALSNELDRPNSGWRRIYRDDGAAVWLPRRVSPRVIPAPTRR